MSHLSEKRQAAVEHLFAEHLSKRLSLDPVADYVEVLVAADLRGEIAPLPPPVEIRISPVFNEKLRAATEEVVKDVVSAMKGFSGRAEPDPPQPSVLVDPRADYVGEERRLEWTNCRCGNTYPVDQRCEECLDREQREERDREESFDPLTGDDLDAISDQVRRAQSMETKTPEPIHQEQQVAVPAPEVAPMPAEQRAIAEDYLNNVFEGSILTEFESGVGGIKAVTDLTDRQARKVANDFRVQALKAQAQDDAARVLSMGLNRTEQRSPIVEEKKPLNEAGLSALIAAVDDLPDDDDEKEAEAAPVPAKDLMPRDMVLMAAKKLGQATFSPSELVPEMRRLGWKSAATESSWSSIVGQIIKRMPEFEQVERGVWKLAKAKK